MKSDKIYCRKQQVLVDMDGVLADVYSQFLELEYKETGIRRGI